MAYAEDILNLLAMHFGGYDENSNIGKILRVIEYTDNEFIKATEDVKKMLDLDQAYGENLDLIHGKNKSLTRGGLSDQDYRQRLKLETTVNNSDGDITTLTESAIVLFGEDNFKGITETDDATIQIDLDLYQQTIPNETFERAVSAAVAVNYATTDDQEVIQFVLEKEKLIDLLHFESGTKTISQQLGVML